MTLADLLAPETLSLLVAGAALVTLGITLFLLDVSNRAQRVFALLLALRGITFFVGPLRSVADSAREAMLWANLAPYAVIPLVPGFVYFLSIYPRRRGLGRMRGGAALVGLATVAMLAWYLLDHSAYQDVVPGIPPVYAGYGPLFVLQGLRLPVFALAGALLASEYVKQPKGSLGFSLFLMVAGFTLNGLFDGTVAAIDLWRQLQGTGPSWVAWEWSRWVLPVAALPIAIVTCARLLPVLVRARSDRELNEVSAFFFCAVPLALLSPGILLLDYAAAPEHTTFVMGVWRLLVPLLLAYALMRYQLFNIDLHLKAGVRRGILIGLFLGVFFLVSESAEAILSDGRAPVFGVAGASMLAALGKPVQSFADRAANSVMPDAKPIERLGSQARFRLYREQFLLVQQDNHVTPKERRMLARLAAYLGLSDDEAMDLEAGVTPTRDDPPPPRARRSASRVARSIVSILGTAAVFGGVAAVAEFVIGASSFLTGLVTAGVVALLLGPIESLAERLTNRKPLSPVKAQAMRDALRDAWADGALSARDVAFLDKMQARLGVSDHDRRRLEAEVRGTTLPTRRRRAGRRSGA